MQQLDVRAATLDDERGVLNLCWLAYHENSGGRRLSEPKVRGMVRNALSGNGLIGIIDVDGDVRAMIGLTVSQSWYSDDPELHDWLAFVRPDCRHLRYFTPLLMFAKAQSDRLRIPLWLGFIGDERADAKARAYHRHAAKFGEFFRYMPSTPQTASQGVA